VIEWHADVLRKQVTNKTDGDKNHLDMTPDTWSKLTNGLSAGGVDGIEWEFVKCPITSPLQIHMHKGASQYWFAATVENATRRTKALEVSVDQGKTWIKTTRNINNFFEAKDPLKGTSAWVKLTSHTDTQVIVKDVVLKSESVTKSTTNYK
jgi:expansin (peptidoglycan-binding protein)